MGNKLNTRAKLQREQDLRYILFNWYLVFIGCLGLIFMVVHLINRRPLVNILTAALIAFLCLGWYILSRKFHRYDLARWSFLIFMTFIYIPAGYLTSPGSSSAMVYVVILTIFMLTFSATSRWEYIFPVLVAVEALVLLRTELWFPDFYYQYSNDAYRINDLSINFVVVVFGIVSTIFFVNMKFNQRSDDLYRLSVTDGLTGLYNRRYFSDFLQSEFNRAKRSQEVFSLIIFDINNFKKVNDTFGHPIGDKVLKDVASILKSGIRNYDVACRAGGDEFVLIMPNTSKLAAKEIVGRMETRFKDYVKQFDEANVSVAYGIEDSEDKNYEELYHMADKELYMMKIEQKDTPVR